MERVHHMLLNPFFIACSVHEGMFRLLKSVLLNYIPFIVLLYGLFVVAGGIRCQRYFGRHAENQFFAYWDGTCQLDWHDGGCYAAYTHGHSCQ
ncbi:sodium:proton antiporter [Megasphaera hexanoica]|uniref:Sodium:proton antiporter n=2 Tax=Megasphaera hexanoica TaxID=1675036 RepID=A0ABW7DQL1_9FIRM